MSAEAKAAPDFTPTGIIASDAKLAAGKEQYLALVSKYAALPSEATQDKVIAALKEKKFDVRVAKTKAEALTIATGTHIYTHISHIAYINTIWYAMVWYIDS